MENHPIPQDVTGFQFKLIGNMTVKQFAYLATGSVFAIIFVYVPIFFLIKVIIVATCAGLGVAMAFLPIEGRPMDLMLSYFIKDLFTSTQYIYHQRGGMLSISMIAPHPIKPIQQSQIAAKSASKNKQHDRDVKLSEFLKHIAKSAHSALDEKEDKFLSTIFTPNNNVFVQPIQAGNDHLRSNEALITTQSTEDFEHQLEEESKAIKQELEEAKLHDALAQEHQTLIVDHAHQDELQKQLDDIVRQKQQLEQDILKLKEQHLISESTKKQEPFQAQQSQHVRIVPSEKAPSVGLPEVPDVPNIIIGIIKDSRGNILPGILVDIKDKDDNPVRAFKTNGLGQFASATPLSNGTYTVHFEDLKGKHQFEVVQIEVKGEIMLPLEIISHDAREALRKELFA